MTTLTLRPNIALLAFAVALSTVTQSFHLVTRKLNRLYVTLSSTVAWLVWLSVGIHTATLITDNSLIRQISNWWNNISLDLPLSSIPIAVLSGACASGFTLAAMKILQFRRVIAWEKLAWLPIGLTSCLVSAISTLAIIAVRDSPIKLTLGNLIPSTAIVLLSLLTEVRRSRLVSPEGLGFALFWLRDQGVQSTKIWGNALRWKGCLCSGVIIVETVLSLTIGAGWSAVALLLAAILAAAGLNLLIVLRTTVLLPAGQLPVLYSSTSSGLGSATILACLLGVSSISLGMTVSNIQPIVFWLASAVLLLLGMSTFYLGFNDGPRWLTVVRITMNDTETVGS
ncbi:MAG: hypothetical protein LBV30_04190 [Propionibacteriaceae bacterium]|jgi:hypothetical protein|nr:hypothetical protein [Propionibacteriaceae bacterium]